MTKPSTARAERRNLPPTERRPTPLPAPAQQGIDQATAEHIQALILGNAEASTDASRELVKHLRESRALLMQTEGELNQARTNLTNLEQRRQNLDGRMGGFIDLLHVELKKTA